MPRRSRATNVNVRSRDHPQVYWSPNLVMGISLLQSMHIDYSPAASPHQRIDPSEAAQAPHSHRADSFYLHMLVRRAGIAAHAYAEC
jgi:hypothetical protein